MAELVIHDRAVKVHFPGILRFEVALFEVHGNKAAEVQMVKEEIEEEFLITYFDPVLAADEGKATPKFEQEFLNVGKQAGFQFALVKGFFQGEEVENVGVLEKARGQGGMRRAERGSKVGNGCPLAFVRPVLYLLQ
ncbi:hypothetical protein SDC9_204733 [bioreactor metagenome]|uniref:Uncharacterized protein n=1 Tax=bioreactor metagenome TaxID=1076179 RepID=A0A645J2U1_9ZZZZ